MKVDKKLVVSAAGLLVLFAWIVWITAILAEIRSRVNGIDREISFNRRPSRYILAANIASIQDSLDGMPSQIEEAKRDIINAIELK